MGDRKYFGHSTAIKYISEPGFLQNRVIFFLHYLRKHGIIEYVNCKDITAVGVGQEDAGMMVVLWGNQ